MSSQVKVGDFVQLHGLQSASFYNGLVALVISKPKTSASEGGGEEVRCGVQILDHTDAWNEQRPDPALETGGKAISVKVANIRKSEDSKNWKISAIGMSILERIRVDPTVGPIDACDQFCQAVWNCFFETVPAMPLTLDHGFMVRKEILEVPGHKIFWLALDAIQHHFIIEKCRGRFRIHQSYVKEFKGFSGKEWSEMAGNHSPLKEMQVHKKYGAGRTVSKQEVGALLDCVKQLQHLTSELIPILLKNVEGVDEGTAKLLQQDPTTLTSTQLHRAQNALNIATKWSSTVLDLVGPLGITTLEVDTDGRILSNNDEIEIVQRDRTIFTIPRNLYEKVGEVYCQLTGQVYLSPAVFLRMVNSGIWYEYKKNPADGGSFGFAIRPSALDQEITEEEGILAAQELSRKAMEQLGAGI